MKKIILLMGIPGSGKGTQGKRLAESSGYSHISTGDLLRGLKSRTDLDEELTEALEIMATGKLVPSEVVFRLSFEAIEKEINAGNGVILDGAVRNMIQAERFQAFFEEKGYGDDVTVLEIAITDEESIKRLALRLEYAKRGEVVPAVATSTDGSTAAAEAVRHDDDPDVLRDRLKEMGNAAIKPMLDYYRELGILVSVDGSLSIDDLEEEIRQRLS